MQLICLKILITHITVYYFFSQIVKSKPSHNYEWRSRQIQSPTRSKRFLFRNVGSLVRQSARPHKIDTGVRRLINTEKYFFSFKFRQDFLKNILLFFKYPEGESILIVFCGRAVFGTAQKHRSGRFCDPSRIFDPNRDWFAFYDNTRSSGFRVKQ